jgi:hypothetical protein|tara:strand:+ start:31 stop:501 length:471 start_codon:yes stop_codon:yes gene_type:complete
MATTIIPSDLTVTISESYTVNGVSYGNTMNKTYASNGQVSQRVMNIAGKGGSGITFTNILALSTVDGQGQVVKADYKYFRITNLDNANTLNLRVYNGSDYVAMEVTPASTFLLMDASIDSPSSGTAAIVFADITAIAGQSSDATAGVDIEFLMVTA